MKKKPLKKNTRGILLAIQHVLIVAAAVSILVVLTGSSVMLTGVDEKDRKSVV